MKIEKFTATQCVLIAILAFVFIILGKEFNKKPIVIKCVQHYDGTLDFESERILKIVEEK